MNIQRMRWLAALLFIGCSGSEPVPQPAGPDCSANGSQSSRYALDLAGASSEPESGRVLIDQTPDGDAVPAADIGEGSFTIELWLRGKSEEQITTDRGKREPGIFEVDEYDWIWANIFLDRDIWDSDLRYPGYGASIAREAGRGVLRFGIKTGRTEEGANRSYTLQGSREVLDGKWHHVALVRDAIRGRLAIYVDGSLDRESSADGRVPATDLSYPAAAGRVGTPAANSNHPELGGLLVIGTEKHDLGENSPALRGQIDEIRLWNVARTPAEISETHAQILPADTPGLVSYLRLEEGGGMELSDRRGGRGALFAQKTMFGQPDPWVAEGAPVACP